MSNLHYDHHQFDNPRNRPVSAKTRISFDDYHSMQTYTKKQSGERRLPTPSWAVNDAELRELLCRFMEWRLMIRGEGDLAQRRERIAQAVEAQRASLNATLDRLSLEYVQGKRDGAPRERLKELEAEIEGCDTQIRAGSMAFVAAVVFLYYRARLDSTGVAGELGLKPPHVRQICYRLHRLAERGDRLCRVRVPKPKQQVTPPPPRPSCWPLSDWKLALEKRRAAAPVAASDKWALAHAMHAEGRHYSEIANEIGVGFDTMWRVLLKERTGPFRRARRRK